MNNKISRFLAFVALLFASSIILFPHQGNAREFTIYNIYKELSLGNAGESPRKDYYVNMGSAQGIRVGSTLEVIRRVATYDLLSEKLYKDVAFPIAKIKVIHVESNAAIARLEQFFAEDKTPALSPRAIMVGDIVRPSP